MKCYSLQKEAPVKPSSLESVESPPSYDDDYRESLKEYKKQDSFELENQQQVYDQVVEASEQLGQYEKPEEVLTQSSAGFVNNEESHRGDINRILKVGSVVNEVTH